MARCDSCGSSILFGGRKVDSYRFCNETCEAEGFVLIAGDQVPDDAVYEYARAVHEGLCPRCGGQGPVDVHTSHWVWSALVMTSYKSVPEVCCQGCGIRAKLKGMVTSLLLGWWGFPFGLLFTPAQVIRNLAGLMSSIDPMQPSDALLKTMRIQMSAHALMFSPPRDEDSRRDEAEGTFAGA